MTIRGRSAFGMLPKAQIQQAIDKFQMKQQKLKEMLGEEEYEHYRRNDPSILRHVPAEVFGEMMIAEVGSLGLRLFRWCYHLLLLRSFPHYETKAP